MLSHLADLAQASIFASPWRYGFVSFLRRLSPSGPKPARSSSRMSPAGEELAQIISARLPHEATQFAGRIEQIRSEMAASSEMLGAWDRPWLASSPELQERLG